jgi:stage II sporulation protein AB (anti-sigma F factor)
VSKFSQSGFNFNPAKLLNGAAVITITATISDDTVMVKVADKGVGIEDVSKAMQPLFTTDPNGERAGIGFAVMQTFMDSLKVKSAVGKGTRVVMTKKILPRE